jgi:hypothetical protein
MQRRGQFFLITALVIVAILIGLGTVYTVFKAPPEKCYMIDLANEMKTEANSVIASSSSSFSTDPDQLRDNLKETIDIYSQSNPGVEIAVVYISPDLTEPFAQYYSCDSSISSGFADGSETRETCNNLPTTVNIVTEADGRKSISLDGNTYYFMPTSDSYFYLVLSTTQGYQHTVVTSDKTGSGACA